MFGHWPKKSELMVWQNNKAKECQLVKTVARVDRLSNLSINTSCFGNSSIEAIVSRACNGINTNQQLTTRNRWLMKMMHKSGELSHESTRQMFLP